MPEVFYDMELEDFGLMSKGFFAKRKADDLRFAKSAFWPFAIRENIDGKPAFMAKFVAQWFGEKEKQMSKEDLAERSKAIMNKLELMQKIQDEKDKLKKNARTAQNNN